MKTTLSVIKADVGSVGGHISPIKRLIERVEEYINDGKGEVVNDYYIGYTGDDIAILFSHQRGPGNEKVHKLASNFRLSFCMGIRIILIFGIMEN